MISALAQTSQAAFTDRLIRQWHASDHTVAHLPGHDSAAARLHHLRTGVLPSQLDTGELDAPVIGGFLDHLEQESDNSVRTRNVGLFAIRSLFRYAALTHPEHAGSTARVLAIPPKRLDWAPSVYLTEDEVGARVAFGLRPGHAAQPEA